MSLQQPPLNLLHTFFITLTTIIFNIITLNNHFIIITLIKPQPHHPHHPHHHLHQQPSKCLTHLLLVLLLTLTLLFASVDASRRHWSASYNGETQHALRHHRGK
ncbi:hypothetical protein TYRP_005805 [Tyrophagus putrescentiae]|nr:hypothetical protein TYRP_005805 [Tyrophagus putrescentiae]